ncbi:hypothetical protein EUGRSUZ_A01147 [Eucalyptus grandis]|uniref:Uncharacterized protein n=2 Tax=Eucalyptus grandis TaxID=71139 RepID=A0ACC3M3V9_EUCGR|nr:hypothetical protein EUGRSUZ_A01147 [Eucalyptus grandis]
MKTLIDIVCSLTQDCTLRTNIYTSVVICTNVQAALSGSTFSFHPSSRNRRIPRNSITMVICVYWASSLCIKSNVFVYEESIRLTGLHEFI